MLLGFESCVLWHANIVSTARDDNGEEKTIKKLKKGLLYVLKTRESK